MKKKIIIVGGGFTGVITAICLSEKYEVSLYEAKEKLGGILTDIQYAEEYFLKGCQYLEADSKWFKKIYSILKGELDIFDSLYHSYTEYKNEKISSDKFECPVFNKIEFNNYYDQKKKSSLADRFNFYHKDISFYLKSLMKKFDINPENFIFKNAINFQLDRITSTKQVNEIEELKKNKIFDLIYALDAKKLNIVRKSVIPKNGYNKIFEKLNDYLKKKNVKVFCKKKIIPNWENNNLNLLHDKKKIYSDFIIWTANPVALLNRYFQENLDSKSIKIKQLDFNYKTKEFSNIYIQVFSLKTSISRIFLYKIKEKQKISVECSSEFKESNEKIMTKLIEILLSFNINFIPANMKICSESKYVRHDMSTLKDFSLISKFRELMKNTNLICCEWDTYGREKKINNLFNNLREKKIM